MSGAGSSLARSFDGGATPRGGEIPRWRPVT